MKKSCSLLALVLALASPSVEAARGWTAIQPSPLMTERDPRIRLHGGGQPMKKVHVYSYADVNARYFDPFQPDELYAEAVLHEVLGALGVKIDYSRYLGAKDQFRFGVVHTARIGRGETQLSLFPILKEEGARFSVTAYQDLTSKLKGMIRTDVQPHVVYVEGNAEFQVHPQLAAILQLYGNRTTNKPATVDSTLAFRCSF